MTLLEINLVDVLSETDTDDRVIVWAPTLREGQDGQLVGTRRKVIPLTNGVGSDEVVPGPLMVQVQCKSMIYTRPREVVVPETGPVTLTDLLDNAGAFTYAPPVVGRVALDAQRAEDAAVRAEAGAATVGDAQSVLDARDDTVAAVATLGDAQTVLAARDDAVTAAEDAEQVATGLPTTIQSELETRVPPLVADAIADDQTVVDAIGTKADRDEVTESAIRKKAGMIEVEAVAGTAWAHTTSAGQRLPLGYSPDGHLDGHAVKTWQEDVSNIHSSAPDPDHAHVMTTPDGHVIVAIRTDGTVHIPGLSASSTPGQVGPAVSKGDHWIDPTGRARPVLTDMTLVAGWGSSSLRGMASELTQTLPAEYRDHAQSGERVEHIAARMGAVPPTIAPVTIPADGEVTVTSTDMPASHFLKPFTGWLAGIHGTLTSTDTQVTFTRTDPGEPYEMSEQAPFVADVDPALRSCVTIISAGKNNWATTDVVETVEDYTDRMVRHLTPFVPRVLVMGHFFNSDWVPGTDSWDRMTHLNRILADKYGELFIDHRGILASEEIWGRTGITPTSEDLDAQAIGVLPPSLSIDAGHHINAVDDAVGDIIYEKMLSLGWYEKET